MSKVQGWYFIVWIKPVAPKYPSAFVAVIAVVWSSSFLGGMVFAVGGDHSVAQLLKFELSTDSDIIV